MSEWRPIETAPKDGARILVSDCEEVWCAQWYDEFDFAESGTDAPGLSAEILSDITHWMPLPSPSKVSDGCQHVLAVDSDDTCIKCHKYLGFGSQPDA